ncbi:hypothetical protein GOODEAATRI_032977 [Goodea atripinnis]|uniref:Uncharacterized protein n=1 Tax=Goodea atripinnis TaxID=208336 RepID=A0ABV0MXB1_9TELE
MLVVSVVVVDGVEHPEEGVEPAGHWEMCATTAVSLDIGHAPAPTGDHSREDQDLRSLLMQHQAKELGGVVKRSLAAGDWQDTKVTNLRYSKSTDTYCINVQLLMKFCCSMRCSHVIVEEKKQIILKLQLFCSASLLSYGLKGSQM